MSISLTTALMRALIWLLARMNATMIVEGFIALKSLSAVLKGTNIFTIGSLFIRGVNRHGIQGHLLIEIRRAPYEKSEQRC